MRIITLEQTGAYVQHPDHAAGLGAPSGFRCTDRRFWMAWAYTQAVHADDMLAAVIDDFGNLQETWAVHH